VHKRLIHSSGVSDVEIVETEDGLYISKTAGFEPTAVPTLEREASVLQQLSGCVGPSVRKFDSKNSVLEMERIGSHDLSDVMHDIPRNVVQNIITNFVRDVNIVHENGFVHRDIKPGNVMLTHNGDIGVGEYSGIVDFGMALISNRRQVDKGALGGTKGYSHPTQMEKSYKEERAHPGQDWYAVGRTISHLLLGGSPGSFRASIESWSEKQEELLISTLGKCWQGAPPKSLEELLLFTSTGGAGTKEALPKLLELGEKVVSDLAVQHVQQPFSRDFGFQKSANERPKRHDVLVVIDGTGSMQNQITDLKQAFNSVAEDIKGRIDLRIDLWSLGDYSRDGKKSAIVRIGERMNSDTFQQAIKRIDASREQHDEAEAYEVALQLAYLPRPSQRWFPRSYSTRTVIVVGDSYAHGWLKRDYWASVYGRAFKGQDAWKGRPAEPPDENLQKLIDDFSRRHPLSMDKRTRDAERKAVENARSASSGGRDDFGGWGEVIVDGEIHKQRPNFEKAVEKCVSEKKATVHTIASGQNGICHSFMKYVAMLGGGTYTHVGQGELKIALAGLLSVVDPGVFGDVAEKAGEINPNTQALNSITTFVIDSNS
jgi:serine/threonine protein kinase